VTVELLILLIAGVFLIACLYSAVGHAGASGYIAVMTLIGLAPAEIRPIALVLNILVASIAAWQFWRAGKFSWSLFWPFALLSVPMAFAGGALHLPAHLFKAFIGAILLLSAVQLLVRPPQEREPKPPRQLLAVGVGAGIGLMSGLTGTGGGIFLTPLLIFTGWARTGTASGVSAPFILVNSVAGLAGGFTANTQLPTFTWMLALAVMVGGTIGSYFGSRRLPLTAIKRLLAAVLIIAGSKLLFG
jgi:hypothetical protein